MTVAAVSSVMITLTLVAIFASVIFNTAKLATDIENNVRVMVYIRKDVADNSETIEKEGQTVTFWTYGLGRVETKGLFGKERSCIAFKAKYMEEV